MSKVLFLLKRREDYNSVLHSNIGLSTGLYNSAKFVSDMLDKSGVQSRLVVCKDNNDIDREVNNYKPSHVIIEALWVVPSKFAILRKLHPSVRWIVRLHSEIPFMAAEGMAMDWIAEYLSFDNVSLGINAPRMLHDCKTYLKSVYPNRILDYKLIYLPNFYPQKHENAKRIDTEKDTIDIGCFGAVRPLKNHLTQAIGAIEFAERVNKKLNFHVNAGRIEMKGEPMINNLRGMFEQLSDSGHKLINHQWTPREDFIKLCAKMDIGLQVSFSETFNIVGADFVSQGVPFVGSTEIPWCVDTFYADPTNSKDIADKLELAYNWPRLNNWMNKRSLKSYTNETRDIWLEYFQ
jgi:hypothetical protein